MDSSPDLSNSSSATQNSLLRAAVRLWRDTADRDGALTATWRLAALLWEFVRDSTPERLRSRFGDADYDWEHRVNTTSGAVGWRDRLLGMFHSPYQPTEPVLFHEMLDALQQQARAHRPDFSFQDFTFIDLGSGKGRTLLMASDYPFRRIVGVELLPALHVIALENLSRYHAESQKCFTLQAICSDAVEFVFPDEPVVLFLFNPFPETGLRKVIGNLEKSLNVKPRPVFVLYHNPLLANVLGACIVLKRIGGTHQYAMYAGKSG
jgi:hypothetical protein